MQSSVTLEIHVLSKSYGGVILCNTVYTIVIFVNRVRADGYCIYSAAGCILTVFIVSSRQLLAVFMNQTA